MKKFSLVIFLFVSLIASGYCETDDDESNVVGYEIILKDGRSIETKMCWEEGEKVFYQKYGSTIGLRKSKVKKIKEIKSDSDIESVQYLGPKNRKCFLCYKPENDDPENGLCARRRYENMDDVNE